MLSAAVVTLPLQTTLPALQTGHVTFGCLNDFGKLSNATLAMWSRLLQSLSAARMLLNAPPGIRPRIHEVFTHSVDRIEFVDKMPAADYFRTYERIDIGLDPFPYGGGTTTCDALWMGVPVVSLAGKTGVGRGGVSILSNIGSTDFDHVRCVDDYIQNLP